MLTGLIHGHSGLAYLLAMSTLLSFVWAALTAATGPKPGLLRVAKIQRILEVALMGLIGLVGVTMWIAVAYPITTWWLWAGLAVVITQGALVARGIKPAMMRAAEGDASAARTWAMLSMAHLALVLGAIAIMHAQ